MSNKLQVKKSRQNFILSRILDTKESGLKSCKGFTLLELLVSIAIFGILAGFSSWAYLNVQKNSDLSNQTSLLVNTIRQVQSYAMTGQTGLSFQEYGLKQIATRIDEGNTISLSLRNNQLLSVPRAYAAVMGGPPPTSEQLDMGIHLETDRYILFYGSIYNPEDSRNLETVLPANINISIDLPTADLVFFALTGEVQAYDANHNTITISHSDGQSHILTVNRLGVVDID